MRPLNFRSRENKPILKKGDKDIKPPESDAVEHFKELVGQKKFQQAQESKAIHGEEAN